MFISLCMQLQLFWMSLGCSVWVEFLSPSRSPGLACVSHAVGQGAAEVAAAVSSVCLLGAAAGAVWLPKGLSCEDRAVVIGAVPLADMLSLHAEVKLTIFLCCVLIAHVFHSLG